MRIIECVASRGGTFKNREIRFTPGLNVIYGANDSGKTLLAQSLIDLIFGTFDHEYTIDTDRWNGLFLSTKLGRGDFELSITRNALSSFSFQFGGNDNSTVFLGDSSKLVSIADIADTADSTGIEIIRLIGQYPRALFAQTGLLNSPLHGSGPLEYTVLRDFFTGATSPFYRNFIQIGVRDGETTAFTRAFTGEMLSLETEIKRIDKELELYDLRTTRTRKLIEEKAETEKELAEINARDAQLDNAKERAYGIQYREKETEILSEEIEYRESVIAAEKTKIENYDKAKDKLLSIFPQFSKFTDAQKDNLSKIQSIYRKIRTMREKTDRLKADLSRLIKGFVFKVVFTVIAGSAAAAGIILYPGKFPFESRIIPASIIEGITIALCIMFIFLARHRSKNHSLHEAKRNQENLDLELCELLARNQVEIDPLAFDNAYEFLLQYFEEYGFFIDQEDDTREIEQSLKDDTFFNITASEIKEMMIKRNELSKGISGDKEQLVKDFPHADHDNLIESILTIIDKEKDVTRLTSERANEMLSRLTLEIDSGNVDDPGIRDILEKRKKLENRLLSLYSMERTIRYSRSVLQECTDSRENALLSACANEALAVFNRLSSNQHVTVIDADACRKVIMGESAGFSPSIIHMMHLAVKLAIGSIMTAEGCTVPLILDEPMMNMDSSRIKKCIEIVEEYAEMRQIVIFTHDRDAFNNIDLIEL